MPQIEDTLPRWDMDVIFPGFDSVEYRASTEAFQAELDDLSALFDDLGIQQRDTTPVDDQTVRAFDTVVERFNALLMQVETLFCFVDCVVAADSRDEQANAAMSELEQQQVRLMQLSTRFTGWIGSLDADALLAQSAHARDHAFMVQKKRIKASHLMAPGEEALAAELYLTGGSAWQKLYSAFTSQILVPFEVDGKPEELPMSMIRNLAYEPERATRRRAYEAELAAWERSEVPIAAALNGLKGETLTLATRRKWGEPLDEALFNNNIDRPTLDAMMTAMRESFPDFRRYLRAKARALGVPVLAWYDLFAPVGEASREWPYAEATTFIADQFGTYSERMRGLAVRAFDEGWIDAGPRPGKVGGAFCSPMRDDESRILANYRPSFGEVSTLAHELGHAYHNLNLAHRTQLQRDTPMGLAETASIFCETIVRHAALQAANEQEQLALLDTALQGMCQVVVDISSRFLFEEHVFESRSQRELSPDEFKQFMLEAQQATYGDGLAADALHPYMWAAKSHYYGSTFYNFPYTFGLLFALGLYARYKDDPEDFKAKYDDLLSSTGLDNASELTQRFGFDIRTPDFWRASLDIIRADIARFEDLVERLGTA